MLRKELPIRVPIHPDIRIQPQWLPTPEFQGFFLPLGLIFLFALDPPRHHQLLQRRRLPQRLRKGRIFNLKPVIDAHCLVFLWPPGRGAHRQRGQKRDIRFAESRGEEVGD